MITLGQYRGENLPLFKSFSLDLSNNGITVIRGMNLNAKGLKDRNNGSGKSLLLSGLAEILISSSPAIERNEAFARKALFPKKDSLLALEVGDAVIMKGRFGGASVKYSIEQDTGALEQVKKDVALEYLAEKVGYSEDLFYTLVYLDGGREFPLIGGTAIQRIQFLSNILPDVEVFGQYYDHFHAKLKIVNDNVYKLDTIEGELAEMQVTEDSSVPTEKQIAKLQSAYDKSNSEYKELVAKMDRAEAYNRYVTLKRELAEYQESLGIKPSECEDKYNFYVDQARQHEKFKSWSKRVTRAEGDVTRLTDDIARISMLDLDDSALKTSSTSAEYADLPKTLKKSINTILKTLGVTYQVTDIDTKGKAKEARTICQYLYLCLDEETSIIGKTSSGSTIAIARSLDDTESVRLLQELQEIDNSLEEIIIENLDLRSVVAVDPEVIVRARKARKRKKTLEGYQEELSTAQAELDKLKAHPLEASKDRLHSEDLKLLDEYRKVYSKFLLVKDSSKDDVVDTEAMSKRLKKLRLQVTEDNEALQTATIALRLYQENESVIASMKRRVSKLESSRTAQPVVEVLKKAFSNNGIRAYWLSQRCASLASRMNASSHLVFPEPVHFRFDISERNCDIMAIRNPGTKSEIVSDIRTLSRGERKSFSLLLLYALLPMTDQTYRFNVVVLDEMTSNMDAPTRSKVFTDFIPALRDVVPHIIIADTGTHHIDDATEYVVVKKGMVSVLMPKDNAERLEI